MNDTLLPRRCPFCGESVIAIWGHMENCREKDKVKTFDYDIVFPCACCDAKSTNYLCGKCAKEHCPSCAALSARIAELERESRRWYLADGSFVELSPEDVIAKRKTAAKVLSRVADVDAFVNFLRKEMLYDHPGDASIIAPKILAFFRGEE